MTSKKDLVRMGRALPSRRRYRRSRQQTRPSTSRRSQSSGPKPKISSTLVNATAWRLQAAFIDDYVAYCEALHPDAEAWGANALLFDRLSGYLSFRVDHAKGTKGGKVKASTLEWWRTMLIQGVIKSIGEAETVASILRGTRADHKDGLAYRLKLFCVGLVKQHKLDRFSDDRKFYGRPKLTLLLLGIEARVNRSPFGVESCVQLQVLLPLSFFTGVRPASLVRSEKTSGFAQVQDLAIVKRGPTSFTIELDARHLKGFNAALQRGQKQKWILHSVTKNHNAMFDLGACLIPWLIKRGVVQEAESGRPVTTVSGFLASSAARFRCMGEGPTFLAGTSGLGRLELDTPLTGSHMAEQIRTLCLEVGLPAVGGYAFRHDVGNRSTVMLGAEAARLALGHGLKRDITRRHYAADVSNVDWVSLGLEEDLPSDVQEKLRRSNRFYMSWSGYATQAMIQILRRVEDDDEDVIDSAKVLQSVKLHTNEEKEIEKDPRLVELDKQIEDGLARLGTMVGKPVRSRSSVVTAYLNSDVKPVRELAKLIDGARGERRKVARKLRRGQRNGKKVRRDEELLQKAAGGFDEMTEAAEVLASTSRAQPGGAIQLQGFTESKLPALKTATTKNS
ncbi:hypothetical protein CF319_g8380 [Tilletia indica]|nr:hypothetical protein CF319_g8380 [Tilletia indica]